VQLSKKVRRSLILFISESLKSLSWLENILRMMIEILGSLMSSDSICSFFISEMELNSQIEWVMESKLFTDVI